ncbi:hypothetical protein NUACC26_076320 [Scytonema sp. NUACC26]
MFVKSIFGLRLPPASQKKAKVYTQVEFTPLNPPIQKALKEDCIKPVYTQVEFTPLNPPL